MTNIFRPSLLILLLAMFVAAGLLGGPASPFDAAVANWVGGLRGAYPRFTSFVAILTQLGSVYATLGVGLLAAAFLAARGARGKAMLLATTVLIERLSVDGLKLAFGRPRPDVDLPFMPGSASFPSGHSANSMAAFVAVAIIAAPPAWRRPAMAGSLSLSAVVGLTRIFLGVHWPSDVIGGWAWGLFVVGLAVIAARRSGLIETQHDIVGRHLPPVGEN